MCGIVGKYYFRQSAVNRNDTDRMMKAIFHRGPDSSGKFEEGRAVLGFQRLSIIDTEAGHQPLYNEGRTIVLLANGEIYNYKEMVPQLEKKGHVFSTRSDCEVIIHLYEEYGPSFISMLNGMFAFCLYDKKSERMLIARDRVGIKPLYYSLSEDQIVFGSEIKGILAASEVVAEETDDILAEYLCFRYLANQRTFFSTVKALEPGGCIELSPAGCKIGTFWDTPEPSDRYWGDAELADAVESALKSSVRRQMMTDVPLGTQLSGGVDSSLVSELASRYAPGLKTFTVGFHEPAYDESSCARLLADTAGLEYHQITVDNATFAENLPQVIWYHDEPLCHANSVHMYLLCTYARQHVKVLLTGEGADELFAGYPRYLICRFGEAHNRLEPTLARVVKALLGGVPARRVAKVAHQLGLGPRDLVMWNSCFATREKVAWLLEGGDLSMEARSALVDTVWDEERSLFDNLLRYEQKSYLQPILMRQDKMSMAASVESRVPVLDNEMLELANNIPYQRKIQNFTPKHVFKKVAARHIPREIVYKKKVGFGVPVDEWLRDRSGLGRYLDLLRDSSTRLNGVSKPRLEQLIAEHLEQRHNHGDLLWPLINYAIWKERFLHG